MDKILHWIKAKLPLIVVVVSVIITVIWLIETLRKETYLITSPIRIKAPKINDLDIYVQYPNSIGADDRGKNAKQIIIFSKTSIEVSHSLWLRIINPIGIINLVDKDRNRTSNLFKIDIGRNNVPVSIWLEHTNIKVPSKTNYFSIKICVLSSPSIKDKITEFDLTMELESKLRWIFKRLSRSIFAKVAPLSLIFLLVGFAARRFRLNKRIQPIYIESKLYMSKENWAKVIAKCKEIFEIDPFYGDIRRIYTEALEQQKKKEEEREKQEIEQGERLQKLYIEARIAFDSENLGEAKELFEKILEEKNDYKDSLNYLIKIKSRLKIEKDLKELYDEGFRAYISKDIQKAIKCFQKIIAKNPDYEDALTRLKEFEQLFSVGFSEDVQFRKEVLTKPEVGLNYIATSMRDVSQLSDLLEDSDVRIRRNIADILSRMGSAKATNILHSLKEDSDKEVRSIAIESLKKIAIDNLVEKLANAETWKEAHDQLIKIGEPSIDALINVLGEDSPFWDRAAEVIRDIGEIAIPKLNEGLDNRNPLVRERIASLLEIDNDENHQENSEEREEG